MRILEVVCERGHLDTIRGISAREEVVDAWEASPHEGDRAVLRLLVDPSGVAPVLDALQRQLGESAGARIVVLPVEATIPPVDEAAAGKGERRKQLAPREELYQDVEGGTRLDFI